MNAAAVDYRNGAMVVGPGGYLVGSGTIHGAAASGVDLVNAGGTISPGFSPGKFIVDGDFQMDSGTLVLEVRSDGAGGWDQIEADHITIHGGTIILKPTVDFDSGAGFTVDFLQTANLTIDPGVLIQINPGLPGAWFDPVTGAFTVIGGAENDLNLNGIDDRIEAILPPVGTTLEWPVMSPPGAGNPVFSFRRNDDSSYSHEVKVQWSNDLRHWSDIEIPLFTAGPVTVVDNGLDPDLISVALPMPQGAQKVFARLCVNKNPLLSR